MFDYYKTLGVERSSDIDAIKKAYRKNALKYHPERNNAADAKETFARIAEAYDILSDSKKRAVYDQYGETGLKNGVPSVQGFEHGYKFFSTPEAVFASFFGGKNPYAELFTYNMENPITTTPTVPSMQPPAFGAQFGGLSGMNAINKAAEVYDVKQDEAVVKELPVTLEEMYLGAVKTVKITRKTLTEDGSTTSEQEKTLTVEVKRGYKNGTRMTFPKEGDQGPNRIPADIVFVLKEQPHPTFTRSGNDLQYNVTLDLLDALTGSTVTLTTLDERVLNIAVKEVVSPGYTKIIEGEGMPLSKDPTKKGNLVLGFNVKFPTYFSDEQKRGLKQVWRRDESAKH